MKVDRVVGHLNVLKFNYTRYDLGRLTILGRVGARPIIVEVEVARAAKDYRDEAVLAEIVAMLHEDCLRVLNSVRAGIVVLAGYDLSHLHEVVVIVSKLKEVEVELLVLGLEGYQDLVLACVVSIVVMMVVMVISSLLDLLVLAIVEEPVHS